MKIAHVVYQCFPNISGSSTRTNHILEAQKAHGFEPLVISSPCQPPEDLAKTVGCEMLNGVKHYRTFCFSGLSVGGKSTIWEKIKKVIAFPYFVYKLWRFCLVEKPDVLHAHAMFYCAISAIIVGKLLKIPTVYEVRSIWYANSNSQQSSLLKKLAIKAEHFAIRFSNSVIAISDGIKSEFSDIREDIYIVRNAIREDSVLAEPKLSSEFKRFGYVGSVIELEGLNYAIDAFAQLKKAHPDIQFHIYGGGSKLDELKDHALKVKSPTVFHGQIPPSEVHRCYDELDCIINCRNDELVAQLVTPLKPLEAIALNKVLICSDVQGYMEIIGGDNHAIVVKPRDSDSIVTAVEYVLNVSSYDALIEKLSLARAYIAENRTWESNMAVHTSIYEKLLS
ncbi:glycosyltransferase family 4 protein [Pseudoalteromonas sp. MTN2-4]|uniref:glycosyltransferase family 4 protein n=1 Tax=Pseudoalteromonas sp. MTN2-4 TaxID=3056555 RepID=UPI0036F4312C